MASLCRDPGGRKRILFVDVDGNRRAVWLGRVTEKMALAVKIKVEALAGAKLMRGTVDDEVSRWVADLPDAMHAKLAAVGLVEARAAVKSVTLAELLDRYAAVRTGVKASTRTVWQQARQSLLDYFGGDRLLRDIHEGDAELWASWMAKQGWAEATRRKRAQNAKQFFAFAVRQELVRSNPFSGLKSSATANDKRLYFVSRADFEKVLDAAPDCEWRLLLALARFGGLRTPSETLALKWTDIDWDRSRIQVTSPKTEHNPGGGSRVIPIFAELRPYLMEAFEQAEPGALYCITRYRHASVNLRTQAHRIIRRAGLEIWPRTFQNLRASRETELSETFPLRTVVAWLGNSQPVAMKHYLTVPDEHFERAARQTAQNTAQSAAEQSAQSRDAQKPTRMENPENADLLVGAGHSGSVLESPIAPRGFEPLLPG